jgi:methylmalonyl-CoA mutase
MQKYLDKLKEYYPNPEEKLFITDFPSHTKQQWLEEIYKVLEKSGKPADISAISWKTLDDFVLSPFYMREDLSLLNFIYDYPGVYPYTRSKKLSQKWEILQYIQGTPEEITTKLEQTTRRGTEGVILSYGKFSYPFTFYGRTIQNIDQLKEIESIIKKYQFNGYIIGSSSDLIDLIKNHLSFSILFDPFLDYILQGNYNYDFKELMNFIEINYQKINVPFLSIRGDVYHNAGLPPAFELGISISIFAEILSQLQNVDIVSLLPKIVFVQASGSSYFLEIAKFRATRRLIAMVLKAFSIEDYKEGPKQLAVSSLFHHSIYDIYNNMLRNTISAMGAIIGGVDSLVVLPITAVNNTDDEFSRRMAINTQLILKYESHLDYVVDPSGGSYYIENVTDKIAEKAWEIFLEIEDQGGFKQAIESNYIQTKIKEIQKIRINNIKSRKEFVLGVNQYPNPKDFILNEYKEIQIIGEYQSEQNNHVIQVFRSPIFFEKLRLKTEELSRKKGLPYIQLIPFGNLAMQRARCSFIMNFFGCAGFEVNDPGDLKTKEGILEFLKQIQNKKIDAFVLCSSDKEYLNIYKEIRNDLVKFNKPVLIAGLPDTKDELLELGIYDFIHIKSNLYETLEKYQKLFFEN